jgi:DNA polymerase-3 subunit delta'
MATTALPGTEHHPHAQAVLGAALADGGRPSHAYLFHGPGGTGKRTAARAFAAELLVEGSRDEAGARARVEHGAHPDLTWVAPTGAHEMRVEDVAGPVVAAASRTPFESSRRVFVLEAAETMNDQAANRLLKTLEEPASYVHLLLLSDRPQELLATIASRCQRVRFDPLPATEIERRLAAAGVDPETAAACARLALGDGRRAHALATGDGPALRAEAERFARAALSGEVADRPWDALLKRARTAGDAAATAVEEGLADQLELAAKRDHKRVETEFAERAKRAGRRAHTEALDLQLELAGLWYRDVAAVADEAADLALSSDRLDELAADAEGRDAVIFREALDLVEDTRRRLALNVSEDLACEALAYRLERALSA